MLPAGRQVLARGLSTLIGRPELADDPRFADPADASWRTPPRAPSCSPAAFAERTLAEWRERLADFSGQWAVVQDTLEVAADPQTVANGYVQDCETADGHAVPARHRAGAVRRRAGPARAGRPSSTSTATPSSSGLGLDWDTIVDLKVRGVVA